MKTRRIFTGLILALILALVNITSALAMPPNPNSLFGAVKIDTAVVGNPPALPSSFFGTVKSNGANVPSGITVTARIKGQIFAKSAFIIYLGDTVYSLDVPGDDPSTTNIVEGGVEGDIVEFYVGNIKAVQTGTWYSGTSVALNLTVSLPKYWQISLPLIFR